MDLRDNIKVLLDRAENDIITARIIADADEEMTEIICYHIQQYVEKSLKAKLIEIEKEYPRTHDIQALLNLLPDPKYAEELMLQAYTLTQYATSSRYDRVTPSTEEMRTAFVFAEQIVDMISSVRLV